MTPEERQKKKEYLKAYREVERDSSIEDKDRNPLVRARMQRAGETPTLGQCYDYLIFSRFPFSVLKDLYFNFKRRE